MKTFQQFREEISVIDMAVSVGFRFDKSKGKKWPIFTSKNNEKLMIVNPKSPSNQGYANLHDDNDKGTLIDFIRNRLGRDFPVDASLSEAMNINRTLYAFIREVLPDDLVYKPNEKPPKPFTTEGLTSYLVNPFYLFSRGISREVLLSREFDGRVLNIENGIYVNTAFPFYDRDERITAIEKRNYSYGYFVDGSRLTESIWHSNFPDVLESIIIAESAIDALSYHQLKRPKGALYVSLGGSLSSGQIGTIRVLKDRSRVSADFKFVSAVDNDKAGEKYNDRLMDWLMPDRLSIDKPVSKDYNKDLLQKIVSGPTVKRLKL